MIGVCADVRRAVTSTRATEVGRSPPPVSHIPPPPMPPPSAYEHRSGIKVRIFTVIGSTEFVTESAEQRNDQRQSLRHRGRARCWRSTSSPATCRHYGPVSGFGSCPSATALETIGPHFFEVKKDGLRHLSKGEQFAQVVGPQHVAVPRASATGSVGSAFSAFSVAAGRVKAGYSVTICWTRSAAATRSAWLTDVGEVGVPEDPDRELVAEFRPSGGSGAAPQK